MMMKTLIKFLLLFGLFIGYSATSQNTSSKTYVVVIENMQFNPTEIVVHIGDTVRWVNKGMVPHDVTEGETANDTKDWSSPLLKPGESWEKIITVDAAYHCSLHVTMKGEIKLKSLK